MFKPIMRASVAAMNRELCIFIVRVRQGSSRIHCHLSVQCIIVGVVGVRRTGPSVLYCHWFPTAKVNCSQIALLIWLIISQEIDCIGQACNKQWHKQMKSATRCQSVVWDVYCHPSVCIMSNIPFTLTKRNTNTHFHCLLFSVGISIHSQVT